MQTKSKALAIISALMLCLVLFSGFYPSFKACAAAAPSDVVPWSSELDKFYMTGGTGSMEGVSLSSVKFSDIDREVYYPHYSCYVDDHSDKDYRRFLTYDLSSSISRFKYAFYGIYACSLYSSGVNATFHSVPSNPYYLYSCGHSKDNEEIYLQIAFSSSPLRYELKNNKYCLISDSDFNIFGWKIHASGNTNLERNSRIAYFYTVSYSNYSIRPYFDFSSDSEFCEDSNPYVSNWEEIFTNCDIEINGHNYRSDPFKKLKDQIDVKISPDFGIVGLDMDIKKNFDDRIGFSVTNNSDIPIQFLAYIDTPDNKDYFTDDYENKVVDYELPHCIIEPAYEKAIWNYEIEDYYYSLDFSNDSKKLGFQQTCKIDTSKCYGATVFIYLDSGQTYTDYVYWKNIHVSTGKEYRMNFLAFPLTVDTASSIFDIEKYKNEDVHSVFGNKIFKQLHWWTLDYKVSISEIAQIYNVDYSSGFFVYQENFSLVSIPSYSPTSVGGKGLVSQGYSNDPALNNKIYDYNMDTGNETFNNLNPDSFSVNIDVDNISVDNVKYYINYCTNFFGLIKGTLSTFPIFIWGLIFFGLTAFVVIALIKWIIH